MNEHDRERYISEAERRGYLKIENNEITYYCSKQYKDNYSDPEEQVRAGLYSWLILDKEYSPTCIRVEYSVPSRVPAERADIILFETEHCVVPYLVIELKPRNTPDMERAQAIEQLFGYANALRTTQYGLYDDLDFSILYDIQNFPPLEREENILGTRNNIPKYYGIARRFPLIAGDPISDIKQISTSELENAIRRAHSEIWSGGKRDPLTSFDEWCKLLFVKIYDERNTPNNDWRKFQIGSGETAIGVGNRIRHLYELAREEDPSIFSNLFQLPDVKIFKVVRLIQNIGFTLMDIDSLGNAFETFFSEVFRGSLGQYFTRRELVRFICSILKPMETDIILDPTAGSGGFLLEALMHVWRVIDERYEGRPAIERIKYDFASNHLFGIEIHEVLGRVCQTNLMLHKDGHTNIEVGRTCLDNVFTNPRISVEDPIFTMIMGNPPFGDIIKDGDTDRLGTSRLVDFELVKTSQVKSEIIIIERSLNFLRPGGKFGMVVPDGLLNNSGENSNCPSFRRYVFKNTKILGVISLPDYAFRKAGAQNKTSLIFLKKFEPQDSRAFDRVNREIRDDPNNSNLREAELEKRVISQFLEEHSYNVFLAEANFIGYTPSGKVSDLNDLYHDVDRVPIMDDAETILGQFNMFSDNEGKYQTNRNPDCIKISALDLFTSHESNRIDPKYHIFKKLGILAPPEGMANYNLGKLLTPREEIIIPHNYPDELFTTLTLSQEGILSPREAGKGNNPPDWHGAYFKEDSRWYRVRTDNLIISRIDIWKGCVSVIPEEFDGAIVTNEFPIFHVNSELIRTHFLKILLRSEYFQKAIRAITTGHSNRRRTQTDDLLNLDIFLPDIDVQDLIIGLFSEKEGQLDRLRSDYLGIISKFNQIIIGTISLEELIENRSRNL